VSEARYKTIDRVALAALFVTALALRLAYRIDYDEDLDALRFRLGVERFDVAALRPHAPFYPVFIAAAKIPLALSAPPHAALAIVSAITGAALVALVALTAREVLDRRAAYLAGALALASPFLWVSAEKLLSDTAGAFAFTLGLWLAARARRLPERAAALHTAALVVLGIALGVRLSYFPIALAALAVIARAEGGGRAWLSRARDLLTGVALWLAPLVAIAGARPLVAGTLGGAAGHFTRWGGSVVTVSSPALRLSGVVWGLWANVLGGAWSDAPRVRWIAAPILVILLALAASRARSLAAQPEIAAAAIAYLAWAILGQNVYKPRHFLPLAPLLVIAIAAGARVLAMRASRLASIAIAALSLAWIADGVSLAAAHRLPSPAAALARELAQARDDRLVVTRDLALFAAELAPARRVLVAPSDDALLAAVPPSGALVTSEALTPASARALEARGFTLRTVFSRPRSRYVDSLWYELALVSVDPK
jgi:4-amino-4-deoxy-L-arabinose transferase-like glycosyltransferase